jgi:membrane protein
MRHGLLAAWALVKETVTEWSDDAASTRAASLAYYTIFSIAPTLVIATSIAAVLFGEQAARGEIQRQMQGLVGGAGAKVVEDMIASAAKPGRGLLPTILGIVVMIFAATGVFSELQTALNAFWKTRTKHTNSVIAFLRMRFLSFAMVLGIGFLLLVSLVLSALLEAVGGWLSGFLRDWAGVMRVLNEIISFGVVSAMFALIFKVLPDRKVQWRDVWLGAAVTSVLFNLGKYGISLYIAHSSIQTSYGAAGSLAVLLVWVYYSSLILFLGAEFTQVYARLYGSLRSAPTTRPLKPRPPQENGSWPHPLSGTARSAGGR